jgi:hypothetical protein
MLLRPRENEDCGFLQIFCEEDVADMVIHNHLHGAITQNIKILYPPHV